MLSLHFERLIAGLVKYAVINEVFYFISSCLNSHSSHKSDFRVRLKLLLRRALQIFMVPSVAQLERIVAQVC